MPANKGQTTSSGTARTGLSLPTIYRLFFLVIEPVSALVGAFYAYFRQSTYLELTHADSTPSPIPLGTSIALSQLANLYFLFALNESLVLRSTSDLRVWKRVLFCLLIADLGHLYTVHELGLQIYWNVWKWTAIDWGNIAFVYFGAAMRIAFLAEVGFSVVESGKAKRST
jgi:hypothetical protein